MALRWYYSPLIGSDIEITDRVNWPDIDISMSANGDVSSVTLIVDDPLGDFIPLMKRRIHANADAAPAGTQLVGNWFIEDIKVSRKGQTPVLAARSYALTMVDENSLLNRRKFVGTDAIRPAETDIERLRWALTTTELNVLSPDETYIDTTGPVNLDAADLQNPPQGPDELMVSLRGASHKNYWVKYEEAALVGGAIVSSSVAAATVITTTTAHGLFTGMTVVIAGHSGSTPSLNGSHVITVTGTNTYTIPVTVTVGGTGGTTSTVGRYVLWYANMNTSSLYPSTISLSNVLSETLGNPLVWELGKTSTELDRDGSRMASGLIGPYKQGWEYVQDTDVGDRYAYIDQVAGDLKNVSTAAKAIAQITGQLSELKLPDDEITTTVTVDEADLNLIRHGMIVPVHATHFPNYTDDSDPTAPGYLKPGYAAGFVNTRVMERSIRVVGPKTFEMPLKLSPMRNVPCTDFDLTPAGHYAPISVSGSISGGNAITGLDAITYYYAAGSPPPLTPEPGHAGAWNFFAISPSYQRVAAYSPSGYYDAARDYGNDNGVQLLVVGDGTATLYFGDTISPTGIPSIQTDIYVDGVLVWTKNPINDMPVAHGEAVDIVLTGGDVGVCIHTIDVQFAITASENYFGWMGMTWAPV